MRKHSNGYLLLPVSLALAITALVTYMIATEQAVLRAGAVNSTQEQQAHLLLQAGLSQQKQYLSDVASCSAYSNQNSTWGDFSVSNVVEPTSGSPVNITTTVTYTPTGEQLARAKVEDVPVFQGLNILDIQPPEDDSKETMITALNPTANYGWRTRLYIGTSENSLIQFNPSALPANATLLSASMLLYFDLLTTPGSISVHRLTADWVEGTKNGSGTANGATWLNRTTLLPWLLPGGEYAAAPEAVLAVDSVPRWYSFDVSRLVRGWIDDTYTNRGMLLRGVDGLVGAEAVTADVSMTASQFPILRIAWGCECGRNCALSLFCDGTVAPTTLIDWGSSWNSYAGNTAEFAGLAWLLEGELFNGVAAPAGGALAGVNIKTNKAHMVAPTGGPLAVATLSMPSARGIARVRSGTWDSHYAVTTTDDIRVYFLDDTFTVQGSFPMSTYLEKPWDVDFISTTASGTHDGQLALIADKSVTYVFPIYVTTTVPGVRIVDQAGTLQKTIPTGGFAPSPRSVTHIPGKDQFWVMDKGGKAFRIDFDGNILSSYDHSALGISIAGAITLDLENCRHVYPDMGSKRFEHLGLP